MNRKNIITILLVLLVFITPLLVYFAGFKLTAFNISFYRQEFDNYGTEVEDDIEITKELLIFLKQKKEDTSLISSFSEKEISHLLDVRAIMQRFLFIGTTAGFLSIIILLLLLYLDPADFIRNFAAGISIGGAFTLLLSFITYLLLKNFDSAFVIFHKVFFTGNWQFPADHLLIMLFPRQFWVDISGRILADTFIIANILIFTGILLLIWIKYMPGRD